MTLWSAVLPDKELYVCTSGPTDLTGGRVTVSTDFRRAAGEKRDFSLGVGAALRFISGAGLQFGGVKNWRAELGYRTIIGDFFSLGVFWCFGGCLPWRIAF